MNMCINQFVTFKFYTRSMQSKFSKLASDIIFQKQRVREFIKDAHRMTIQLRQGSLKQKNITWPEEASWTS